MLGDRLDRAPVPRPEATSMVPRLGLTSTETRIVTNGCDGHETGHTLLHGGAGRHTTLILFFILSLYGLLDWAEPKQRATLTVAQQVQARASKMAAGNHFEALDVHWSANSVGLAEAYRLARGGSSPAVSGRPRRRRPAHACGGSSRRPTRCSRDPAARIAYGAPPTRSTTSRFRPRRPASERPVDAQGRPRVAEPARPRRRVRADRRAEGGRTITIEGLAAPPRTAQTTKLPAQQGGEAPHELPEPPPRARQPGPGR